MSTLWLCLLRQTPEPECRKGRPRAYAYYRCLGTDAYRFGGERICPNTQVRTDRLELAVWHEVCALLAHPERLAQEFHRRLHAKARSNTRSGGPWRARGASCDKAWLASLIVTRRA